MAKVTLYSKPDCTLCDAAHAALERVRARAPFTLEEVDVTSDRGLVAEYAERVPVVALDGRDVFDYVVDEAELERLLTSAAEAVG
jgi:glutaredoxin